jgi:hypothetical protein
VRSHTRHPFRGHPEHRRSAGPAGRAHAAPAGGEAHKLWWRPHCGHGRGVLYRSGHVHTWPEGEATHRQIADLRRADHGDAPRMFFTIRPDGRVRIPARHAGQAAELSAALTAADARLAPFVPA